MLHHPTPGFLLPPLLSTALHLHVIYMPPLQAVDCPLISRRGLDHSPTKSLSTSSKDLICSFSSCYLYFLYKIVSSSPTGTTFSFCFHFLEQSFSKSMLRHRHAVNELGMSYHSGILSHNGHQKPEALTDWASSRLLLHPRTWLHDNSGDTTLW